MKNNEINDDKNSPPSSYRDRYDLNKVKSEEDTLWDKLDKISYSLFGDYYSNNLEEYDIFSEKLKQAGISTVVDLYLSKITLLSVVSMFLVVLLLNTVLLSYHILINNLGLVPFVLTNTVIAPLVFILSIGGGYLYPTLKASNRKREIDKMLPHAVTFMYAMSRGGMNFVDIIKLLSNSKATYKEVANQYDTVAKEMKFFNIDLPTALRRSSRRSPSEKFKNFNDDLISVLNTGADLTEFLYDKSEDFLDEERRKQENFIETLEVLGEIYVTVFVAAPLFLIIITVIMNMMGGSGVNQIYLIVYLILPVMTGLFFVLIDTITEDTTTEHDLNIETGKIDHEYLEEEYGHLKGKRSGIADKILNEKKKQEKEAFIKTPIKKMFEKPIYSLYFTVPLALISLIASISLGLVQPSIGSLSENPVFSTVWLFVIPFLLITTPYTIFYEFKARREQRILKRMPDALSQFAGSNNIGMTLSESLEKVSENTAGALGEEFKKVKNDVKWNHDVSSALVKFANRVQLPVVSRTVKLIVEANKSSGDISKVLEVAANDTQKRRTLKDQRFSDLTMYTVVILVSFGVYLFVIVLLDITFLSKIVEMTGKQAQNASSLSGSGGSGKGIGGAAGGTLDISNIPVNIYRMVFYHSAIIQAIGSGLLSGYLSHNDIKKGLKYTIILTIIATLVFALI